MREWAKIEPAGASPIEVDAVAGYPAVLDDLAAVADARHAFLRRAWFAAAGGARPRTLLARRPGGQVVAALPSVDAAARIPGVRAVPGSYWPVRSFPVAPDINDAEIAALLGSPVARRALGRAWRLGPLNGDDPTALRVRHVALASGWRILERRIATSFILDMDSARASGWPRSSTLKKNRFHEKHLAARGKLEWRFLTGSDWSAGLFDQLAAVERASWVGEKSGTDPKFVDARQRSIWEHAARDPALAAMMHVGLLTVGGAPAAFSFGIEAGSVRYCIATSYDRRFAKHSPGKLVSYRTYLEAAERGITFFDDGAGDGGHKSVMGETPGPEIMDYLFVRGRALAALLRPFWGK